MNKTLVIGANGILGSKVTELLAKTTQVKAAQRDISKAKTLENVEVVEFDYDRVETYDKTIENIDRAFVMAPPLDMGAYERLLPFLKSLKNKGVKKVVFLSALGVDADDNTPLRKLELELINNDFNYVILRPNFFMENFSIGNFAPMLEAGQLVLNTAEGKTSFISAEDIAQIVEKTIFDDSFNKQAFNITGSEAITMQETLNIIENRTNKKVQYLNITNEQMKEGLLQHQMPESNADFLVMLLDFVKNGYLSATTNDVEQILGKKPLTFKEFIQQYI